jgi:CRP-like cAMP-binding protein
MFPFDIIGGGDRMEIDRLRQIPMLANSDSGILDRCIEEKQIFIRKYAKGATVHRQRERCTTVDVVLSGSLVAYSHSENGSAIMLFELKENGIVGANLIFGDDDTYPLNIYAAAACTLLHMSKTAVVELLRGHDFVMHYVKSLSMNAQGMNRKIAMLTQKTLRENILDYLRHQAIIQGSSYIRLPITKKELADYMGVQRPSLFRELKKMKDDGLIDISNRFIRVLA